MGRLFWKLCRLSGLSCTSWSLCAYRTRLALGLLLVLGLLFVLYPERGFARSSAGPFVAFEQGSHSIC